MGIEYEVWYVEVIKRVWVWDIDNIKMDVQKV
jgi:hypothetical protein